MKKKGTIPAEFPNYRPRRMRRTPALRNFLAETALTAKSFIAPFFVKAMNVRSEAIRSMPGQFRYSPAGLLFEIEKLLRLRIPAMILFGMPEVKDSEAREAYAKNGIVQKSIRAVKKRFPEMIVIADTCLCEYMSHGHCGMVRKTPNGHEVMNDPTLKLLARTALSQAEAGADLVAPSDMMDGRVRAIREKLDRKGFARTGIMSYAAKYASVFYGPFRDAAGSTPRYGDRKSYQMDVRNREEAIREIALDINEGADIVMVKPALACLDIIREAKERFRFPLAAYNVSGEYVMVKWAAREGWNERALMFEILTAIKRAGADRIISYHAVEAARYLEEL